MDNPAGTGATDVVNAMADTVLDSMAADFLITLGGRDVAGDGSDYDTGARLAPGLPGAQINRGAALYNLGRYPEAMEALNAGLTTDDPDIKAVGFYNRGLTAEKLGNIQGAYEDFKAALDLDPMFELAERQLERFEVVAVSD